jgi:hypothetical protein
MSRRIPKTLHYCFGLTPDFDGRPWSLVHYACMRSAVERIRPDKVLFRCRFEPSGAWWDLTRPLVQLVSVGADVSDPMSARLTALIEDGGIFLEADVLVQRSFDPLLEFGTVLGIENVGTDARLGTGVMVAEPGAPFLRRWLEALRQSRGEPAPLQLTVQPSDDVRILPFTAFHWPLWIPEHLEWIFETTHPVVPGQSFVRRLWQAEAWQHLIGLTPGFVRSHDSNALRWLRPFVADLPDHYGATESAPPPARTRNQLTKSSDQPAAASRREAFQQVYATSMWGNDEGRFFSGSGSRGSVVERYVDAMTKEFWALHQQLGRELTVVDVGCGDFFVGGSLLSACPFIRYIGCDIVPELIDHHQKEYGSDRASFRVLDIVTDQPPAGDVCLVRQVFQHLSNADVLDALDRLRGFEAVYLTEGNPVVRHGPVNPDKASNGHIRFGPRGVGRGLEWREPPFSLRCEEIVRAISPPLEAIVTDRVWLD